MESPIKCFNIEAFGNHHRVFADQSVDAEYVQETLNLECPFSSSHIQNI